MSALLDEIKERRKAGTEQASMMLDMVPSSDMETRYSLLSTASHFLNDVTIKEKWISLIAGETDTRLKADMLYRLAAEGWQQIANKEQLVTLLSDALQQDESRNIILSMLGKLSLTDKKARQKLMDFYRQQNNAAVSGIILSWLLIPADASEEDIAFYLSILDTVDEQDKLVLVNRLLLQDKLGREQLEKLLRPDEPASIKAMVLRYCLDRSVVPEEALCTLIQSDKNTALRTWCIQLLALQGISNPRTTAVILQTGMQDPDTGVRQAALHVFEYSLSLTPATIDYLCQVLQQEKSLDTALLLLRMLAPYTAHSESLCQSLLQLLDQHIQTPVAVHIYTILGRLVPKKPALFDHFLAAYEKEQHDECKAAILQAITHTVSQGPELNSFYLKALKAPSPVIKEWGIRGLLLVPLTRENTTVIAEAAPVLLETGLNRELRRLLAKKISCIPQPTAAITAVFSRLADHDTDAGIREISAQVQEKAISQSGGESINWEQWLHKADVEHDLSGIFPHIWFFYQDHPEMANRILWSAINPANSSSLYSEQVNDVEILRFLAVNAGVNDDMSRYVLNQLLHADLGYESKFNHYLLILKGNPGNEELKDGLWQLLEKRGRYINLIQLNELHTIIWGAALEAEFSKRMLRQTAVAGILPYIKYLSVNGSWQAAPALLKQAVQLPGMLQDQEFKTAVQECCRNCGVDADELFRTAAPATPGFADEGPGFAD